MSTRSIVYLDEAKPPEEPLMKFRLTYAGPLLSTQRDPMAAQSDPKGDHKHQLRKAFHPQLKRLWDVTPFLSKTPDGKWQIWDRASWGTGDQSKAHSPDGLAVRYSSYGFQFVPLVTEDIELYCGLDVLFLRPDKPGKLWAGDIDNRIKTLIDALRIPAANEDYVRKTAEPDEQPFFVLLEDDKLITRLSVETDQLLEFATGPGSLNDVRLIITVHLWPYAMHTGNLEFGGGG